MGSRWVPQHIGAGRSRRNAKNAYLNAVALQRNRSAHAIPHILQNRRCTRIKRGAMMEVATRLLPRTPQAPRCEGLCHACAKTPRVVDQGFVCPIQTFGMDNEDIRRRPRLLTFVWLFGTPGIARPINPYRIARLLGPTLGMVSSSKS